MASRNSSGGLNIWTATRAQARARDLRLRQRLLTPRRQIGIGHPIAAGSGHRLPTGVVEAHGLCRKAVGGNNLSIAAAGQRLLSPGVAVPMERARIGIRGRHGGSGLSLGLSDGDPAVELQVLIIWGGIVASSLQTAPLPSSFGPLGATTASGNCGGARRDRRRTELAYRHTEPNILHQVDP